MKTMNLNIEGYGEILIEGDPEKVYLPSNYARNFIKCITHQPLAGKKFLDMGCGTGAIGIAAAKMGADVVCLDINENAVSTTLENARINNVKLKAFMSNGFESINSTDKFDIIACNTPSNPNIVDEVITPIDNGEDGRTFLDYVLQNAPFYLNSSGRLLSCTGSEQDWEKTVNILRKNWSDYKILLDFDEDFSSLSQFSVELLEKWIEAGYCWKINGKVFHTIRYFFAYK